MTKVVNKYKEEYDIYCGRGSIWGNPFISGKNAVDREDSIAQYKAYFYARIKYDDDFHRSVLALSGKVLGCFCKPKACHCDIIAEYLNERE